MRPQLTIEALADWAAKQPAHKDYNPYNPNRCAIAQFAQSLGFQGSTPECGIRISKSRSAPLLGLDEPELMDLISRYPRTFGALAARLRA